jgi:hypothetical protein
VKGDIFLVGGSLFFGGLYFFVGRGGHVTVIVCGLDKLATGVHARPFIAVTRSRGPVYTMTGKGGDVARGVGTAQG